MWWPSFLIVFLVSSVLSDSLLLTPSNFVAEVKEHGKRSAFVMFYAPWCGHCKRLKPDWGTLGDAFNRSEVLIAEVDCTISQPLCVEHKVRGFPTLLSFKAGSASRPYKGPRSLSALTSFVKDNLLSSDMVLYYFGHKGRDFLPRVVAAAAGLPLVKDSNATANWGPSHPLKLEMPFGQLPALRRAGRVIAQSGAIVRVLAQLGGIDGATPAEFEMNQMLVEEFQDIVTALGSANRDSNRKAAMDVFFAEKLPAQLKYLTRLLGESPLFSGPGPALQLGDCAIAAALHFAVSLQPDCLGAFPALNTFYTGVVTRPALAALFTEEGGGKLYEKRE